MTLPTPAPCSGSREPGNRSCCPHRTAPAPSLHRGCLSASHSIARPRTAPHGTARHRTAPHRTRSFFSPPRSAPPRTAHAPSFHRPAAQRSGCRHARGSQHAASTLRQPGLFPCPWPAALRRSPAEQSRAAPAPPGPAPSPGKAAGAAPPHQHPGGFSAAASHPSLRPVRSHSFAYP